ncbi:hypothetical protein [Streptomyces sp. NPDC059409]|uniref:hypothetical protein n=1 Tax=Streptomyces sp. NPDC059409 TaxID=3346824 RepID=UPI0036B38B1F
MIFFETEADPTLWFPLPLHWTEQDQEEMIKWSVMCAEIVHQRHKTWWRRPKRLTIADRFAQLAEAHPHPSIPARQAFLYSGDARMIPQPVYALVAQSEGKDRDAGLRAVLQANEENPVRPPDITEFHSARLGHGMRCIRYFGNESSPGASVNYGWWSEEHQTYATVRTVSPDVDWLTTNLGNPGRRHLPCLRRVHDQQRRLHRCSLRQRQVG